MDTVGPAATPVTPHQLPELTREITNSEKFFKYFQNGVTNLQDQIERLQTHGASGGERADAVAHCQAGIARLSDAVHDASALLPAYDQRSYGEAIKALSAKLEGIRASFAPRPKFSFKSSRSGGGASTSSGASLGASFPLKKNASAISIGDAAELANQQRKLVPGYESGTSGESSLATTPAHLRSPAPERVDESSEAVPADQPSAEQARGLPDQSALSQQSTAVKINDHSGQHIILPASANHATISATLSNLRRCVVDMSSPTASFATLTLKNIDSSLIICGHVSGAAHLTNITNSVLVIASRQFRMHESRANAVYLQTTSRPIIEDCTGIQFAPLPAHYLADGDDDGKGNANEWDQVDDFKWLRSEPSPNWGVLDGERRVGESVWRDVVPGGAGVGVEEILRAVGVEK